MKKPDLGYILKIQGGAKVQECPDKKGRVQYNVKCTEAVRRDDT